MSVREVGEVNIDNSFIWWNVDSFNILPQEENTRIWSPVFITYETKFFLHHFNIKVPRGSIGLIFNSKEPLSPLNKCIQVGLVDESKTVINYSKVEWIEKHDYFMKGYFRVHDLCKKKSLRKYVNVQLFCELINDENDLIEAINIGKKDVFSTWQCMTCFVKNSMTEKECITCYSLNPNITTVNSAPISSVSTSSRNISTASGTSNSQILSKFFIEPSDSVKSTNNKIPAGNEGKSVTLSNNSSTSSDVGSQYVKNLEKLSENLKGLYVTGQDSDLTIKVRDNEFKAHKNILRSRSSVFNAMFSHELSERNSSVIPIEDCEPDIFEEFLYFIYSGKIRQLSSDNACDLYYVADKYLIQELKEECIHFLKKSLSIETICDVICLSTKCNEAELLDLAITYFARNMEEILLTVKWQLFMTENPTAANELTIKALRLGFTKKKI